MSLRVDANRGRGPRGVVVRSSTVGTDREHVSHALRSVGQWKHRTSDANVDLGTDDAGHGSSGFKPRYTDDPAGAADQKFPDRAAVRGSLGTRSLPLVIPQC